MTRYETIYTFRTRRYTLTLAWAPETDPDVSWADQETLDKLNNGDYVNATFRVRLSLDGHTVAEDYLGNSIYADVRDFRDHFGMRPGNWGSYYADMVAGVVAEARKAETNRPKLRRVSA